MKPKLIVFDLNETLINTNETWDLVIPKAISKKFKLPFEETQKYWIECGKGIWELPGIDTKEKFFKEFDKRFMERTEIEDYKEYRKAIEGANNDFAKKVKVFPGVIKTLVKLKNLGIKTAILNGAQAKNTPAEEPEDLIDKKEKYLLAVLKNTSLDKYIDKAFLGIRHKVLKPSKEAFELPLKYFKVKASEAVMVGDKDKDIKAIEYGYTTILFDPKNKYKKEIKPDYKFRDWNEFVKLINEFL